VDEEPSAYRHCIVRAVCRQGFILGRNKRRRPRGIARGAFVCCTCGGSASFRSPVVRRGFFLKSAHDAEEIVRTRVPAGSQHPVQTFARLTEERGELFKSNGCVDKISEDGLSRHCISSEIGIEGFREQSLPKSRVSLYPCRYGVLEFSCECHANAIMTTRARTSSISHLESNP
jgi:hypothetical protein